MFDDQEKEVKQRMLATERKARSRDKFRKEFGRPITLNMSISTLMRFRKICRRYGYDEAIKKGIDITRAYNHVLSELVNVYFIDHMIGKKNKAASNLYNTYNLIWEARFNDNMTDKDIAVHLTKNQRQIPIILDDDVIELKGSKWTEEEVKRLHNTNSVITMVNKLNRQDSES